LFGGASAASRAEEAFADVTKKLMTCVQNVNGSSVAESMDLQAFPKQNLDKMTQNQG
jgi:hypothetical protein